jgi:hypothetical protein
MFPLQVGCTSFLVMLSQFSMEENKTCVYSVRKCVHPEEWGREEHAVLLLL